MGRLGGCAVCFFEWDVACERIALLKKELGGDLITGVGISAGSGVNGLNIT